MSISQNSSEIEDGQIESEEERGQVIIEQCVQPQKQQQQNKQKVFEMKSSNFKTKVCEHFKRGSCKFGEKCPFIHPSDIQLPICKFFLSGHCNKEKCDFSHDLASYHCKFLYGQGSCTSVKCKFSHEPFPNEISKAQWVKENYIYLLEIYKSKRFTGIGDFFINQLKLQNPDILIKFPPILFNKIPKQTNYTNNFKPIQNQNYDLLIPNFQISSDSYKDSPRFSPIEDNSEGILENHSSVTQDAFEEITSEESNQNKQDPRLKNHQKNKIKKEVLISQKPIMASNKTINPITYQKIKTASNFFIHKYKAQKQIKMDFKIEQKAKIVSVNQIKAIDIQGIQGNKRISDKRQIIQNQPHYSDQIQDFEWEIKDFNVKARPSLVEFLTKSKIN